MGTFNLPLGNPFLVCIDRMSETRTTRDARFTDMCGNAHTFDFGCRHFWRYRHLPEIRLMLQTFTDLQRWGDLKDWSHCSSQSNDYKLPFMTQPICQADIFRFRRSKHLKHNRKLIGYLCTSAHPPPSPRSSSSNVSEPRHFLLFPPRHLKLPSQTIVKIIWHLCVLLQRSIVDGRKRKQIDFFTAFASFLI